MLEWVSVAEAEEIVRAGGQWLDVRLPSEFENQHLDGATLSPNDDQALADKLLNDKSQRGEIVRDATE